MFARNYNLLPIGGCNMGMAQANRAKLLTFLEWTGLTENGATPWWCKSNCKPDVAALMWLEDTNQPQAIVELVKSRITMWTQENLEISRGLDRIIKDASERQREGTQENSEISCGLDGAIKYIGSDRQREWKHTIENRTLNRRIKYGSQKKKTPQKKR